MAKLVKTKLNFDVEQGKKGSELVIANVRERERRSKSGFSAKSPTQGFGHLY